jgi:quercetin dioxygenase-like cupin family protein
MTATAQPHAVDFLGATARVLASGGALGLVHMDLPAGDMPPLHVHRDEDEGFYVLAGALTLYLPGESVTLGSGDFFWPRTAFRTPTRSGQTAPRCSS